MAKKISIPKVQPNVENTAHALGAILGTSFTPNKQITMIAVSQLAPYPKQNIFGMRELDELADSIKEIGITTPLIVRRLSQSPEEQYQIITGHRRKEAAILAGLTEVPAIIEQLDDDQADLVFTDNLYHRRKLLPSERAFALKVQMEALERKAEAKTPVHSSLAEDMNTNRKEIYRQMKVADLVPKLLEMVDNETMPYYAGYNIAFLPRDSQEEILDIVESEEAKMTVKIAENLREAFKQNSLNGEEDIRNIICPPKKATDPVAKSIKIKGRLGKYFNTSATVSEIEDVLVKALELYFKEGELDV